MQSIWILILAPLLLVSYAIYQIFFSPLRSIPGPLLAKITNLWRFMDVWKGQHQHTLRRLHKKHGDFVRIGPNVISIADPTCVKKIYTIKGEYVKSEAYAVADVLLPDHTVTYTSFSVRNEKMHADIVRPVQKLFNLNNIVSYEDRIDEVIDVLTRKLDDYAASGKSFDLWQQSLYIAYDTIGCLTFGSPYGYLETQSDFNQVITTTRNSFAYYAAISQMPWLDQWLGKSSFDFIGAIFHTFENLRNPLMVKIQERLAHKTDEETPRDLMEDAIKANGGKNGDAMPKIIPSLSGLIVAGSDTTAMTLTGLFLELLRNPEVYKKLQHQIDAAALPAPITYASAKDQLPYLGDVLKEALRCHPANQLPLERIVPASGARLSEAAPFIPPGTIIGCSSAVVQTNTDHFGLDAMDFKPERWQRLENESEEESVARIGRMSDADLAFGAGRRVCIGKQIALVQIWKVVATILQRYDIELAGGKDWKFQTRTDLNAYPVDLPIKIRRRHV